jgi:hypothetical protein
MSGIEIKMKIMKAISTQVNKLINSELIIAGIVFLLGLLVIAYELMF